MGKEHALQQQSGIQQQQRQQQEQRARTAISSCVRSCFALRKDQDWLADVFADALLAELSPGDPGDQAAGSDGADQQQQNQQQEELKQEGGTSRPVLCGSDLPTSAADAEAAWGALLTSTLDLDEVEPGDVAHACGQLLDALCALVAQFEEEDGGSAGADDDDEGEEGACEMCGRVMPLTKHHLIPRDVHSAWKKRGATLDELQAGAMICRSCHNAVHRLADNKTLAAKYNTVPLLMQEPALQRHVAWAQKQKVSVRPQRAPGTAVVKRRAAR